MPSDDFGPCMTSIEKSWVLTDPHYNHAKLVERGYRPACYENMITASWLRLVDPSQVVYCLGDVAWKGQAEAHEKYIMPMPGYKILIRGNHDKQKDAWYLTHGWNEVHELYRLTSMVSGRHTRILLSHIPQPDDNTFDLNLHGHFHDDTHRANEPGMIAIRSKKHLLLSLERVNYQLVSFQDFIEGKIDQTDGGRLSPVVPEL